MMKNVGDDKSVALPLFQEVDSMRSEYYSDLCSKFMIENTILKMEYAEVRVFSITDRVSSELPHSSIWLQESKNVSLPFLSTQQNLTSLCHLDQLLLVTHINLSSNRLQRLPPQFAMLQCLEVKQTTKSIFVCLYVSVIKSHILNFLCKSRSLTRLQVLEADNNFLENLEGVYHLPRLQEVSLKNNSILTCRCSFRAQISVSSGTSVLGIGSFCDLCSYLAAYKWLKKHESAVSAEKQQRAADGVWRKAEDRLNYRARRAGSKLSAVLSAQLLRASWFPPQPRGRWLQESSVLKGTLACSLEKGNRVILTKTVHFNACIISLK